MNDEIDESENQQNIVKHATEDVKDQIQQMPEESQLADDNEVREDILLGNEDNDITDAVLSEEVAEVKTKTDSPADIGWV